MTTVPGGVLAQASPGRVATPLQQVPGTGPPLTIDGKPAIVFVSEESCPFCAAERWSLAVALSHFGSWSQLGVTKSAATDIFPNTATLSFRTARYQSTRLTLRTTELTDNSGHPCRRCPRWTASSSAVTTCRPTSTARTSPGRCPSSTSAKPTNDLG